MTISEAYRLFVEERQVNGVTQKTLMFYRDTAEKFAEFVGLEVSLDEASKGINQYFLGLRERELSQASIHTHWRAVKTFWRFAFTEGYIDH